MQIRAGSSCAIILAIALLAKPISAANVADFIDFSLRAGDNTVLLPGRLHLEASDPSTPRPLVLFLHGAGESGTNNLAQINGNIDNLLAEMKLRDAFLYAPQTNSGWSNLTVLTRVLTMVDRAIAEQDIDINRIYVTGLSMGGGGVWNMLTQFPDRFAAAVPICPVAPSPLIAANLIVQPIWDFHARNDTVVSVGTSRFVINNILSAAGQPFPAYPPTNNFTSDFQFDNELLDLHYTEFRSGGHGIWPAVYQRQDMYDWMFAHSIVPEPNSLVLIGTAVVVLGMRRRRCQSRSVPKLVDAPVSDTYPQEHPRSFSVILPHQGITADI